MESCPHVNRVDFDKCQPAILNPLKWACMVCESTENSWICLQCGYVGCGRYVEGHALDHYRETVHPLCMDINETFVFCYTCDDYVLNDSGRDDLKLCRQLLHSIATQDFSDSTSPVLTRGRAAKSAIDHSSLVYALRHRRLMLLTKYFAAWRNYVLSRSKVGPKVKLERSSNSLPQYSENSLPAGLQNLGNTCYMNSVLQVLGNMSEFRTMLLTKDGSKVVLDQPVELLANPQTCTRSPASPRKRQFGLNGGSQLSPAKARRVPVLIPGVSPDISKLLLPELQRVVSALWTQQRLTPNGFLDAVWTAIPAFRGFCQQDAQEFLGEMLEKLKDEVRGRESLAPTFIDTLFNGELVSQVHCLSCGYRSNTYEPFSDLSLEFPANFQFNRSPDGDLSILCPLTEMLDSFTAPENLGSVYLCPTCNADSSSNYGPTTSAASSPRKRRRTARSRLNGADDDDDGVNGSSSVTDGNKRYSQATKRLLISRLPQVLRLHLKRFRWASRNDRKKIAIKVDFAETIDMHSYCDSGALPEEASTEFRLFAAVMHHGRGFKSGHYTAYCRNGHGPSSWVHCNDAHVLPCTLDDVLSCQAYMLFYSRILEGSSSAGSSSGEVENRGKRPKRRTV